MENLESLYTLAKQIGEKYPEVWRIDLTGSRAKGTATDQSDWDICIQLTEDLYTKANHEDIEALEQKIQFSPEIQDAPIHVHCFFLRPSTYPHFPVFCHGDSDALVLLKKDSEDVYRESVPYMFLFWQAYITFLHSFARHSICLWRRNNNNKGGLK